MYITQSILQWDNYNLIHLYEFATNLNPAYAELMHKAFQLGRPHNICAFIGGEGEHIEDMSLLISFILGTDDELLVASSDPDSSRDEKETKKKIFVPQQTVSNTTMCPSTNMHQVPIDVINQFPSSAINLSLQQICNSAIVTNSAQDADGEHFAFDSNESYPFASGASLTNSTSDFNDAGYKTVDLDSACLSSVQSSVYS